MADPYDAPVAEHAAEGDFPRRLGAGHEHVAREQLGPAAEHEAQAQAEAQAADQALRSEGHGSVAQKGAEVHGAEADEGARQHGRHETFGAAHGGLGHADGLGLGLGGRRGQLVRADGQQVLFHN